MDNSILALILGLSAAIGWGISGFFDAKASRSVHPIVSALLVNAIVAVGYAIFYILFLQQPFDFSASGITYAVGGGAIITIGALAYFKGLSIGPVSLVSPMSSAYPFVTVLLAVAVFDGRLSVLQLTAIMLVLTGIFIVTELIPVLRKRKIISRGPILGIAAALCWGVGYALVAQAIEVLGWQNATLIELGAMLFAFLVCIPLIDRQAVTTPRIIAGLRSRDIWIAGVVALGAATSFNIGLAHDVTSGAIVATISSFYPILTVLLALRHFDEHVPAIQLGGALVSIAGVILLGIA